LVLLIIFVSKVAKFFNTPRSCVMMVMFGKAFFQFDLEQEDGVLAEGPEDEDDAGDDPGLDGGQALGLRRVGLDRVEDVDEDEKDCHQESHST
jgi:hypothetical protein